MCKRVSFNDFYGIHKKEMKVNWMFYFLCIFKSIELLVRYRSYCLPLLL